MESSKLVVILRTFNKKELRDLHRFLQSPYLNETKQKEKVYRLFELLQPALLRAAIPIPTKEEVYQKLFPDSSFSNSVMDKLMARLLKVVRRFIVFEHAGLEDQSLTAQLIQAKFYRQRQLPKYFRQTIKSLREQQAKILRRDHQFYLDQYKLEREISEYEGQFNSRKEDLNLPQTHRSLDEFYCLSKLEYTNWMLTQHQHHVPLLLQETIKILDQISPMIETHYCSINPLIEAHYYAYRLLKEKTDTSWYERLNQTIAQHQEQLPVEQLQALTAICRSFCVQQYNLGQQDLAAVFQLYQKHLAAGYLYYDDQLHPSVIKNLVNFGLKSQAYDWVQTFLQSHEHRIFGTDYPEWVYRFNLAQYHFALQEYDQALTLLENYPEDIYYKIAAKRLELKIFYELSSPLLESKMDSLKIYLFRISKHQLPDGPKAANNNFINLLRQIHNPQTYRNTQRSDKIQKNIRAKKSVAEREWLLQKLDELQS